MKRPQLSRRDFMQAAGAAAGAALLTPARLFATPESAAPGYALTIATTPLELAPNRIVSVTTYNGQFPGPLLRLEEGRDCWRRSRSRLPGSLTLFHCHQQLHMDFGFMALFDYV